MQPPPLSPPRRGHILLTTSYRALCLSYPVRIPPNLPTRSPRHHPNGGRSLHTLLTASLSLSRSPPHAPRHSHPPPHTTVAAQAGASFPRPPMPMPGAPPGYGAPGGTSPAFLTTRQPPCSRMGKLSGTNTQSSPPSDEDGCTHQSPGPLSSSSRLTPRLPPPPTRALPSHLLTPHPTSHLTLPLCPGYPPRGPPGQGLLPPPGRGPPPGMYGGPPRGMPPPGFGPPGRSRSLPLTPPQP